jgi:stage III sporulation protein SpoIIIAA
MVRMLEKLTQLVDEVGALHSKLILLIDQPGSGKTALLAELANQKLYPSQHCPP